MTESERIHVNVSVAIVTDQHKQVLLTFNDNWGLAHAGLIPEDEDPEIDDLANQMIARLNRRRLDDGGGDRG